MGRSTAASLLIALVALAGAIRPAAATEVVKVATGAIVAEMAPLWIGRDEGLYRRYGLDVQITPITAGLTAVQALLAGELHMISITGIPVAQANLGGADILMIASVINLSPFSVMAARGVTTAQELKGKRLGITRFGSAADIVARMALKRLGLEERDVTIVQIGGMGETLSAMQQGSVAAGMLTPPLTYRAEGLGFRELLNLAASGEPMLHTGMGATRAYLRSSRERVLAFLKGYIEAIALFKRDRELAIRTVGKYMRMSDRVALERMYGFYREHLLDNPRPTAAGMKTILDFIGRAQPEALRVSPARYLDLSFLDELEASGFLKRPAPEPGR